MMVRMVEGWSISTHGIFLPPPCFVVSIQQVRHGDGSSKRTILMSCLGLSWGMWSRTTGEHGLQFEMTSLPGEIASNLIGPPAASNWLTRRQNVA